MQYQQKLDDIERKFEDLNGQMADPAVISDSTQYRKVSKAHNELAEIVSKYRDWKTATRNLAEARPMLTESDPELRGMAEEEDLLLELGAGAGGERRLPEQEDRRPPPPDRHRHPVEAAPRLDPHDHRGPHRRPRPRSLQ